MAVGDEAHLAVDGEDALDHAVHAGLDVPRLLAAGGPVAPEQPVGPVLVDLLRRDALVLAVVPLHEVGLGLGGVESRERGGLGGAAERAGQDERERALGEPRAQRAGGVAPVVGEREVGAAGVPAGDGPGCLGMAHEQDAADGHGARPTRRARHHAADGDADTDVDVVVVGLGPTGQVAAGLLAQHGLRVVALEREARPFGFPRAAATDDVVLRVLHGLGVAPPVLPARAELVGADGRARTLLDPRDRPLGHPRLALFHQPDLEAALLARLPPGVARFGSAVAGLVPEATGVTVRLTGGGSVRARYVLACDGGSSAVRTALGIGLPGRTAERPWLVVDARVPGRRVVDPVVRFTASPARPTVEMPLAREVHRWEALLAPGEDPDAVAARWPADVLRATVYAHHARTAARWRAGRVLLLGDAAHLMPPFAGQGWGAGVRDAANLAWKLALVLRGHAPDALLDTYAAERRPDVRAHTALTLALGAAIQTRRPRVAALRDAGLGTAAATPVLGPWALDGGARPPTAVPFGQPLVGGVPLDDLVGPRFAVLGLGTDPVVPPGLAHLDPVALRVDGVSRRRRVVVLRPDRFVLRGPVRRLIERS